MKNLIRRLQTRALKRLLKKFPVVAVIGARQTGKTTLVQKLLEEKERSFFSFDDPTVILSAQDNPLSFLNRGPRLTIDEVQKYPDILSGIKRIVDQKRVPGQFLITGSANISLLPKISETLAGRIAFVEMTPLSFFEINSRLENIPRAIKIIFSKSARQCWNILKKLKSQKINFEKLVFRGGYPTAWLEANDSDRQEWFKGYVRTYLERDVRDLARIQRLYDFQKFLSLAAFRCSQILNRSDLAKDAGIPYTTANHFFDLLLKSFQVFLLEPYFRNIGKRLIKAPKLMWTDTGVAFHLQGLASWIDAERLGRGSFLIENKIALEIKTLLSVYLPLAKLYYWRTNAGAEIDLIIENSGRLIPIEVKWSEKVSQRELVSMEFFLKDFKKTAAWGLVLYRGENLLQLKENIFLVPMNYFLG